MGVKVCPRCGRTEKEVPFIGFFCRDCYLELNPPIKESEIKLKVCPTCGRIFVGYWTEFDLTKVAKWIKDHIKISNDVEKPILTITLGKEDEKTIEYRGILTGVIQGTPIEYRFSGTVRKVYEQCPYCARRAGGYYEAVIQLRGERWKELYKEVIDRISKEKDPKAFVTKEVPRREGIDIFVGSKKVAEKVAKKLKQLGAKVKFSYEQVTEKDGKPVTREFISIRL